MKFMRNAGYTLREIMEMDAYEVMISLGFILYDNEIIDEEVNAGG